MNKLRFLIPAGLLLIAGTASVKAQVLSDKQAIFPATDFSYDFQDLDFTRSVKK